MSKIRAFSVSGITLILNGVTMYVTLGYERIKLQNIDLGANLSCSKCNSNLVI